MVRKSVEQVFEWLGRRTFQARLLGVYGSFRFDIIGIGSFYISVYDGAIAVRALAHHADCTITCAPNVFLHIVSGTQNLLMAAMRGQVDIRGDLALAKRLPALLSPPLDDAHAGQEP